MLKKLIIAACLTAVLACSLTLPLVVQAQDSIVDTSAGKYDNGDYTLDDMVLIAIRASRWILGIVGSLALLMFIYGGVMLLISSGSSEKITQAKNILVAAVIGLLIVFGSFLIIKFVLKTIGINWDGSTKISLVAPEQKKLI